MRSDVNFFCEIFSSETQKKNSPEKKKAYSWFALRATPESRVFFYFLQKKIQVKQTFQEY